MSSNSQPIHHVTKIDDLPMTPEPQSQLPVQQNTMNSHYQAPVNSQQNIQMSIQPPQNQYQNTPLNQQTQLQQQYQTNQIIQDNSQMQNEIQNQHSYIPQHQIHSQIPSRDIPMNTVQFQNDPQIQPNYIETNEYNKKQDTQQNIEMEKAKKVFEYKRKNNLFNDSMIEMIKIPIFLILLYFSFQLPIFDKNIYKYMPSFYLKEGKIGLSGIVFKSVVFGGIYFIVHNYILQNNV